MSCHLRTLSQFAQNCAVHFVTTSKASEFSNPCPTNYYAFSSNNKRRVQFEY